MGGLTLLLGRQPYSAASVPGDALRKPELMGPADDAIPGVAEDAGDMSARMALFP